MAPFILDYRIKDEAEIAAWLATRPPIIDHTIRDETEIAVSDEANAH
jgi:hypothetical protein